MRGYFLHLLQKINQPFFLFAYKKMIWETNRNCLLNKRKIEQEITNITNMSRNTRILHVQIYHIPATRRFSKNCNLSKLTWVTKKNSNQFFLPKQSHLKFQLNENKKFAQIFRNRVKFLCYEYNEDAHGIVSQNVYRLKHTWFTKYISSIRHIINRWACKFVIINWTMIKANAICFSAGEWVKPRSACIFCTQATFCTTKCRLIKWIDCCCRRRCRGGCWRWCRRCCCRSTINVVVQSEIPCNSESCEFQTSLKEAP